MIHLTAQRTLDLCVTLALPPSAGEFGSRIRINGCATFINNLYVFTVLIELCDIRMIASATAMHTKYCQSNPSHAKFQTNVLGTEWHDRNNGSNR